MLVTSLQGEPRIEAKPGGPTRRLSDPGARSRKISQTAGAALERFIPLPS
jgi:hypothetical protein